MELSLLLFLKRNKIFSCFMKLFFLLLCFLGPVFKIAAAVKDKEAHATTQTSSTAVELSNKSTVKIIGHQLIVNGKPYAIKGVCYSPIPKGGTYPNDLLTQYPTPENLDIIKKDFQMMRAAGINTIRVYVPILHRKILDLLQEYHLRVIVPVCNSYSINQDEIRGIINVLKDEPTTLFWEIGNECNFNYFNTACSTHLQGIGLMGVADFAQKTTATIKEVDSEHPISLGLGRPTDEQVAIEMPIFNAIPNIDFYGLNFYNGLSLTSICQSWNLLTDKPFYFSEVGATAYNLACNGIHEGMFATDVASFVNELDFYFLFGFLSEKLFLNTPEVAVFGEDERAQADGITSLASQIKENLSAANPDNFLIGGCIFEWNDEWWKAPWKKNPEDFQVHSISGNCLANTNGLLSWGPYPDHYFHEEWFGITTIDRIPRESYFSLQKVFLEP